MKRKLLIALLCAAVLAHMVFLPVSARADETVLNYVEFSYEGRSYLLPVGSQVRFSDIYSTLGLSGSLQSMQVSNIFDQAQKIRTMRQVKNGNSTYPYGEMLRCPHCGKLLVHGSLNNFYYDGSKIQNGGWGCYSEDGCGDYLIIQNVLDEALIKA